MTRADCMPGGARYQRPCTIPCRHNLTIDAVARRRPGRPTKVVRDASQSFALDVADEGRHNLVTVGRLIGVTRERVRQIEAMALARMRQDMERLGFDLGDILHAQGALAAAQGESMDALGRNREKLREYNRRYIAKKLAAGGR